MWRLRIIALAFLVTAGLVALAGEAHAASTVVAASGPTSRAWYFAEGRIGAGFLQWLTIGNPNASTCAVTINYFYTLDGHSSGNTKTVNVTVNANTRYTESANNDLGIKQNSGTGATLSATVSVDTGNTPTCSGVVAERPMYFSNFHGVSSGTNVFGATRLNTTWYFADVPTHTAGASFLAILNPGDVSANVTAVYYAGGSEIASEKLTVSPNSRGTFQPNNNVNLPAHISAVITSDRAILVERPSYFTSTYGVSGSANVTGAPALSASWYFAEGSTATGVQTNLTIANMSSAEASVTIILKSLTGAIKDFPVKIAAKNQLIWSVNSNNTFSGSTPDVAIEIKSNDKNIVAQRQMYSTYRGSDGWQVQSATDTIGAPAAQSNYSFAEGFTSVGFNEWLLLQNPNSSQQTISVTLSNMLGHSYTGSFNVPAQSRYTINITAMVKSHLVNDGEDSRAYAVSMSVSSGTPFIAERSMYWSAFGTEGANSIVGYTGD